MLTDWSRNVECRKYREHITAAVDNALEHSEQVMLDAHLAQCPSCKSEFELEELMRSIVKSRCARKRAPGHVLQRITEQLEAEHCHPAQQAWWSKVLASQYFRPAIGFAFALTVVVLLLNNNPSISTPRVVEASMLPPNDIIKQALANYHAVVSGEIKPTLTSNQVDEMKSYFAGKTQFPVVVPVKSNYRLLGGVLNEYGGEALAHVVYNCNNSEIVYIYETCWKTVQGGSALHLAKDVQDELRKTGWYSTTAPDGRSLVMWTDGTTLCSAVSTIDENVLKAFLSEAK